MHRVRFRSRRALRLEGDTLRIEPCASSGKSAENWRKSRRKRTSNIATAGRRPVSGAVLKTGGLRMEAHSAINRLLGRSGTVYELNNRGRIERLVPSTKALG